ncbi:MAG TPA: alpha/beta hydrolase [Streptosporangiaceae bacterium]|jgi:pimeloyl-ACP methyl ester carboxylesterase
MGTVAVNGISLAYDDSGGGEPLVLVHGHPFDRSMWRPQIAALTGSKWRVIAPDLRGLGGSSLGPADGPPPWDSYAKDIAGLLDRLGVDAAVIAGLSMGGQVALEFRRLSPGRARALVLADTFAQTDPPQRKQWRYDLADRLEREGMGGYAQEVLPKMIAPYNIAAMPGVAGHVLTMMRGAPPAGAAAALRSRAERPDYTGLLPAIDVPVLVVVGRDDEFTPIADAEFMRKHIGDAALVIIDGAGHMPNLEREAEFNDALQAFLSRL